VNELKLMTALFRFCVGLILMALCFSACRHKPAYSDIDPEAIKNQNRNTASQPAAAPTSGEARPPVKRPSFVGAENTLIRDLPDYPHGRRTNLVMGPNQGQNVLTILLTTADSMDSVIPFYDQVVKKNGWTVVSRVVDQELSEWNLRKGENDLARVTVKKEPQTQRLLIDVYRSEKMEESPK